MQMRLCVGPRLPGQCAFTEAAQGDCALRRKVKETAEGLQHRVTNSRLPANLRNRQAVVALFYDQRRLGVRRVRCLPPPRRMAKPENPTSATRPIFRESSTWLSLPTAGGANRASPADRHKHCDGGKMAIANSAGSVANSWVRIDVELSTTSHMERPYRRRPVTASMINASVPDVGYHHDGNS